jgi:hypothetical protein
VEGSSYKLQWFGKWSQEKKGRQGWKGKDIDFKCGFANSIVGMKLLPSSLRSLFRVNLPDGKIRKGFTPPTQKPTTKSHNP